MVVRVLRSIATNVSSHWKVYQMWITFVSIIALHVCGSGLLGLRPEAVRTRECCPEGGLIIRDRDKARGADSINRREKLRMVGCQSVENQRKLCVMLSCLLCSDLWHLPFPLCSADTNRLWTSVEINWAIDSVSPDFQISLPCVHPSAVWKMRKSHIRVWSLASSHISWMW